MRFPPLRPQPHLPSTLHPRRLPSERWLGRRSRLSIRKSRLEGYPGSRRERVTQLGQLRWLDRHRRQSHMDGIGDRWPDTLATHQPPQIEAVRPNKKRHRVRAALDAAHLSAKRNGTSRRGKPWRLLRAHRPKHDDIRRAAASCQGGSPDNPKGRIPTCGNAKNW